MDLVIVEFNERSDKLYARLQIFMGGTGIIESHDATVFLRWLCKQSSNMVRTPTGDNTFHHFEKRGWQRKRRQVATLRTGLSERTCLSECPSASVSECVSAGVSECLNASVNERLSARVNECPSASE